MGLLWNVEGELNSPAYEADEMDMSLVSDLRSHSRDTASALVNGCVLLETACGFLLASSLISVMGILRVNSDGEQELIFECLDSSVVIFDELGELVA